MAHTGSTSTKKRSKTQTETLREKLKRSKKRECELKKMLGSVYSDLEEVRDTIGIAIDQICDPQISDIEEAEKLLKNCRIVPKGQKR